jgi:DNA-cytosine methyltransferase
MNVLSLFDGMSCGQQALERAGIEVNQYFASEIDKYAIQVTMANYPNTIQLGSVVGVDGYALPKIDLLIGGSPCQSFSFAGKRKGMATTDEQEILTLEHYLKLKGEGYEFEGQSYLFWEFMRLLYEVKPKYFLLENVEMGEKWERVLTQAIGVNALHINSALVSAQNRKRIYFTNIGMEAAGLFGYPVSIIQKPKDRKILLKDILESEVDEKYFLSERIMTGFLAHNKRHIEEKNQTGFNWKPTTGNKKAACLRSNPALCATDNSVIVHNTMPRSSTTGKGGTGHLSRNDGKTYCLDTGNTNAVEIKAIMLGRSASWGMPENGGGKSYTLCKEQPHGIKITGLNENQQKKFNPNINADKANTLTLAQGRAGSSEEYMDAVSKIAKLTSRIRRLTPLECQRLQTVNDNYKMPVSDSQKYKMLGNGWTIEVISHIFKYIL